MVNQYPEIPIYLIKYIVRKTGISEEIILRVLIAERLYYLELLEEISE